MRTWARKGRDWLDAALEVRRRFGKGLARQLFDIVRLRRAPMRLGPGDYYDYRLFDDATFDDAAKRRFVGWAGEDALDALNASDWRAVCDDKLLFHVAMAGARVPVPPLLAVFHAAAPELDGVPAFTRSADLAAYLREGIAYPFFVKPVHAGFGDGCALALGYDPARDALLLDGERGGPVAVPEFMAALHEPRHAGYLFQRAMAPHPEVAAACAGRLSTLRVMVLWGADGPEIYRMYWKVPRAASIVDNFRKGAAGTMVAQVDLASGRVLRVVRGYGLTRADVVTHPDSGQTLPGLVLPDWERAKALVLHAARALPGLRFQHWDLGLGADGPFAIEVNLFSGGGTEPSQIVCEAGLLEPRLVALCRAAAAEKPRIPARRR